MIRPVAPMRTLIYDSASLPVERWAALCERGPQATVFHSASWSQVWERSRSDARAQWRVLTDDHGRWIGGIPLVRFSRFGITRLYSQPLGTYGGWIGEEFEGRWEVISQWTRQWWRPSVAELVVTPFRDDETRSYPGRKIDRTRHVLDLSLLTAERSWEGNLRPDTLRNLIIARKHGWWVERVENSGHVERTRPLWEQTFDRHQRKFDPGQWRFYRTLCELISPSGKLFWWTAGDGRGAGGTIICLHSGDRFFYHDGAMDLSLGEGRPMYALFDRAIETAVRLGCRTFDFGSGPAGTMGLERFKEGWGAVPELYSEYHYRKPWWPGRS